ncbi:hypothetical protein FNF29_06952 [Cafeteria roenbergensis]|uniref:Uncharacterized protein n=2 Tax=Cafeteria roenbergensis TaxID=33653 RepID=A0A5A8C556_CAFRO|nr:hypothetical protein FNF29_06952 [Cafeteria roenbergensis]|eukprot:KAA0148008.1 hypothetical protein FNF29_06952 [Cafeteria roenbergensis]
MELPPDFAEEAKTISDFRRTLEAQRLGSMDPMDAKSAVARWHSDVQSLTSKLAAQLTYSRALSKHEEVTSLMTEPPEQRERRELQQWIAQTKTDTRFLHDLVCESVHHPASKQARRAQVRTALEASRAGSSAAATAAIMNVATQPLDPATIASRELERRLRSLVFEDEDELLAVVKDPRGTAAAARAGRRSGDRSNIDPSVKRAMTSAADLRMRAHGKFRKGYLVPGAGGGTGGRPGEAGSRAGSGGAGGGAGDRRVAFGEVQELLKLRDESVSALAAHVLRRHAELQSSLGLSGWSSGQPGAGGGGGGGAAGGIGGGMGDGGGGGGGSGGAYGSRAGPGGSAATGTPRLRRLRESASSFATSLADVLSVFDSVDAVLRRVRLTEEGRSTATTIVMLQHELDEAKASLAEKEVERLRLAERLAALKQSRSGGVTTQAMEIDTQLLEAQQTRAQLVVREREAEALARQSNETAERNAALQREITLLRTRLGTAKEALRPRVVEVESRTREALSTVQELRQSLDLLAGMYQRACDQLAASKRCVEDLTEERGRLAKAVQAEVKRARVLAGEVARMDAVNVRLMAAHDSLRAAYRGMKTAAGDAGRGKAGREAAQRAAEEAGTEAMRRLAGGIKSIAREAMERLRLVQGAGGDGSLLSAEALRRIVDVCHTASSTGAVLTQEPVDSATWGASR